MKTILISILSFIAGVFASTYIDLLDHKKYGDEWTNYKKDAIRFIFK